MKTNANVPMNSAIAFFMMSPPKETTHDARVDLRRVVFASRRRLARSLTDMFAGLDVRASECGISDFSACQLCPRISGEPIR